MNVVQITVPAELLEAAGVDPADASRESARLLALELYRENEVSLGRTAEFGEMPTEAFMVFAGKHEGPMHYSVSDLEEDRLTLERAGLPGAADVQQASCIRVQPNTSEPSPEP